MSNQTSAPAVTGRNWASEKLFLGMSFWDYLKSLATPGNFIAGLIMAIGLPLIAYRFIFGLGAVDQPLADEPVGHLDRLRHAQRRRAGRRRLHAGDAVYIFGLEKYHPVVRPAVLTGFLGYLFAVLGPAGRPRPALEPARCRSSSRAAGRR